MGWVQGQAWDQVQGLAQSPCHCQGLGQGLGQGLVVV